MNALTGANAALAGFFLFAAIHYATVWFLSRGERVLLVFASQCVLYAASSTAIALYFRATTIRDMQTALDALIFVAMFTHAAVLHFYAILSGRRDAAFRIVVTCSFLFLAALSLWVPLRGTIVDLRPIRLPGGGTALLPVRTPPGASLALLYLTVFAAHAYGFAAARDIWKQDRIGGALIAFGSTAVLAGASLGVLVDFAHVQAPYAGAWPHAIFVVSVSLVLSRKHAARGAQLLQSERRLTHSLQETREVLSRLQLEKHRREQADRAHQQAMEAFVHAQKAEVASQLAAGAAHDFTNVLCAMSMWSTVMLNTSRSAIDEDAARRAIASTQQQGQTLARQMMALARPEARSVTRFPLERPAHAAVEVLSRTLPRRTTLAFEVADLPNVDADEGEIQQVIYNLVLNAGDAMPDGGVIHIHVGVETFSTPVKVVGGSLPAGRWATLTVTDSGTGIDPAIQDRIFDLFFTTKGPGRGNGFGLATVLRIATINGGGIALDSELGHGASFRVYLPAVAAAAPERREPRSTDAHGT